MAEAPPGAIEGLQRMIEPMDPHEFHAFREIVAALTGDQEEQQLQMIDDIGGKVNSETAAAIARLAQRSLMKG